jgi:imidazoleglycerol-phosphate dehydratase
MKQRKAKVTRKTKETSFVVSLNLDGTGKYKGAFGVPFLEHMLELFAQHGFFDLEVAGKGDVEVDLHHTVEDLAICLGKAFQEAVGDKRGIMRFGAAFVPMEESLAQCVVDVCSRPFLHYRANLRKERIGNYEVELTEEFFRAFAMNAAVTLHINLLYGKNSHHVVEAMFKAFAQALGQAVRMGERVRGVLSTKGTL